MAVQALRFGGWSGIQFEALLGRIQETSFSPEAGGTGRFDLRRSKTLDFDGEAALQPPGTGPYPGVIFALDDAIGPIDFEAGVEPALRGGFFTALEFDNAGSGGGDSGGGSSPFDGDGYAVPLGDPTQGDGSFAGGAVSFDSDTPVSEAMDRLNETLGLLIPAQPPAFPNGTLSVGSSGASPRLASGVTDNASAGLSAGASVARVTGNASTNTLNDVGPGKTGTITGFLNGAGIGSVALTGSGDAGTYSNLVISDQDDFPPSQPGFWKSLDVSLSGVNAPVGVNEVSIDHDAAGSTNAAVFVRDDYTSGPGISALSASINSPGALSYSSSVPHYGAATTFDISGSIDGLAGKTYYGGGDVVRVAPTGGIAGAQNFGYGDLSIATPLAADDQSAKAFTITASINGSVHGSGRLRARARNVNGTSSNPTFGPEILTMLGSGSGRVVETAIPVNGLGGGSNAERVALSGADNPAGAASAWDSAAALPADEAAVVAGVLAHDETDYSSGYMPVGPDLSAGRSGAQYATFSFNRAARSNFVINIQGSYDGLWVRLPGVSDQEPNAPGGWWDMFEPYDGAGVPGETGDPSAGCADGSPADGGSGAFTCTFGTQSSSNATANEIQVRVKLSSGQSISQLSFSG